MPISLPSPPGAGDVWGTQLNTWLTTANAVFNVKLDPYNAAGDGTTNDSAAIQAAITACAAAGGGTVYLPPGTYILNSYLTISSSNGVTLRGDDVTLKLGSGFSAGAQGQGHIFITGNDVTVDGLRFDGNGSVLSPHATNNFAIWGTNSQRCTIRNCYFTAVNTGGSNVNAAIVLAGTPNYARVVNNTFNSCEGGAVFVQGADSVVAGNIVVSCNDVGIVFNSTSCRNGTAVGNTVDSIPAQCAFGVENGAYDITITGNTVKGCFGALDCNDAGYAGGALGGVVFSSNTVTDLNKGASSQTSTIGCFIRGSQFRDIQIVNNNFKGLVVYGTNDSFVFAQTNTEGLIIRGNTFEGKAQALPAAINLAGGVTHTRPIIEDNTIRSTSSGTKLSKGIWIGVSGVITNGFIRRNLFQNITNYCVHFDSSVSFTGTLQDNWCDTSVGAMYQTSPWGTFGNSSTFITTPAVLCNTSGHSIIWVNNAAPASGTWLKGDIAYNFAPPAAGTVYWVCTTAGTPGTWTGVTIP